MPIGLLGAAAIIGGAQAAGGLFNAISGRRRRKSAEAAMRKRLANMPKFQGLEYDPAQFEMPQEALEALNMAKTKMGTSTAMPGEDLARQSIMSQAATGSRNALRSATSAGEALQAQADIYGRSSEAVKDLAIESARFREARERQNEAVYMNQLQNVGNLRVQGQQFNANQNLAAFQNQQQNAQNEFYYNQFYPSQVGLNMAQSGMNAGNIQQGAGMNQIFQGIGSGMQIYAAGGGFSGGGAAGVASAGAATGQPNLPGTGGAMGYKGV